MFDQEKIIIKSISHRFNGKNENLLEDLNLSTSPGLVLTIMGNNDSGKSTLMKIICGQIEPN